MKLLFMVLILCILVEEMFSRILYPTFPELITLKKYRKQLKVIFLYIYFFLSLFYVFWSFC